MASQIPSLHKNLDIPAGQQLATFAGGCFWGLEDLMRKLPGVTNTEVGYAGGSLRNPGYNDVKQGDTGHAETVQLTYDPKQISFETIMEFFFRMHDPTTPNRQGNDRGSQYRSVIFYHDDEQKAVAEKMREIAGQKWGKPAVTEIVPADAFFPAEHFHQDYLVRNPDGYTCHWLRNW